MQPIYHYHPETGVYVTEGVADIDPRGTRYEFPNGEEGEAVAVYRYLLPAHATTIAPPETSAERQAVFNGEVWQSELIPVPEPEPETTPLALAKVAREEGSYLPITVGFNTFDATQKSQELIEGSIRKFAVLDAALGGKGVLPWTLTDNSIVNLTKIDLLAVEDALVIREAQLHYQYQEAKALLGA